MSAADVGTDLEPRTLQVRGREVEYLEAGSGSPLVLLHGDGNTARDWCGVMATLASTHRVVAVSLPGHGGTAPGESYTPDAIAAWLLEVLDALDLPTVALAGNSLGALVAIHVTLQRPDRVVQLVLLDCPGLGRAVNPLLAMETAPGVGEAAISTTLLPGGPQVRAAARASMLFAQPWRAPAGWWVDQVRWGAHREFLVASVAAKRAILNIAGQRHLVLDRLADVHVPTLVVWGLMDQVLPVSHAHAAVRRLPNARVHVVHDAGHLVHVERPDAVARAVLAFLGDEDSLQ